MSTTTVLTGLGGGLADLDADIGGVARQIQLLWGHVSGAGEQQQRQIQPGAAEFAEVARVGRPRGLARRGATPSMYVQKSG